ncbi:MAG: putative hydrolase of the superfamily [Actinomycetota bacterium]|jgi:putative hydrolase of the HAD superfamily|nr:putative hydrolase of the superfamily [Actinomycetota bacterium]MDQ1477183.1 putative hydrolase of the superfamily [Actinomycetota bacterium]
MGSVDESAASFPAVPRRFPAPPKAILLDVGGVFLVPTHDRIMGAFTRAGFTPSVEILDRAHYAGALTFPFTADETIDWATRWRAYLDGYMTECGTPEEMREDVHQHLDSEFADAALWLREFPGSRDGLRELAATGVRLGIISNADGLIGGRLAEAEILQVGPGLGVAVECVIDSGAVGVMKPDPRIFRLALDAMDIAAADAWYVGDMPGIDVIGARAAGLHPVLMDPYELHLDADYDRIGSLSELAKIVGSE